jgi:T4 gene Gp59 loader of gp41 DNA helicase
MNAFEVYKDYLALKRHFNSDYDYFKYNGKVNASKDSFNCRKDKIFFPKLAKHNDPKGFLISNLLENNNAWIREIAYSVKSEEVYNKWLGKKQSLCYKFKEDLSKFKDNFNDNIVSEDNSHPYIVMLYLRDDIMLETLCIVCELSGCLKYWSKKFEYDPVMEQIINKIVKYIPFIEFNPEKYKKILVDIFDKK